MTLYTTQIQLKFFIIAISMDRNKQKAFLFRLIIEYELEKTRKEILLILSHQLT